MRKRLLLLFSALCIIVLCVALAACTLLGGNNTNDNNTGKTEKTLQTVSVEVAGRYARYFSNGTITLPADVTAEFGKADFEVTGKYSDKSTETIRNYTIDVRDSGERSSTIEISVDGQVMYTISVIKNPNILPALPTDDFEFEYNGEEMNVIQDPRFEGVLTAMLNSRVSLATGSVAVATDAGDYSFTLNAANGYVWKEGDGEMTSVTFNWKIKKKVVTLPTVNGTGSYVYDGNERTLSLDMHGLGEYFTFVNGGSDTRKATDVGTYTCQVMIKGEYQKNYTFPGDHSSAEAVDVATWTITPQKIAYPVLTGYKSTTEEGNVTFYHYDYTGSRINFTTNVDDFEFLEIATNEDVVDVIPDGGYYCVTIGFKNEFAGARSNYAWDDNSAISDVSYNVVVDPIDYELPQAVQSATLYATGDYSRYGGTYDFGVNGVELTSDTITLLGDILIAGESEFVRAENKPYEAGTKTIKYNFTRSKNYNPLEVEISVTINKAKIEVESPVWSGWQKTSDNPENNVNYDVGEGNFIYNGFDQKKTLEFYYWNSELIGPTYDEDSYPDLYATATYNVYYGTTEGVYGENPVMTESVTANEWSTYAFSYTASNSSNVGYYKTVVTLSIGDDNYTFVNSNGEEQTSYETTWQIKKAVLTVYPSLTGTFRSDSGITYYTGVNKTVESDLNDATAYVQKHYNANGDAETAILNATEYVDLGSVTNYVYGSQGWEEAHYTRAVGRYKTVVQISLKDAYSAYYTLVVENGEQEWSICGTSIDASAVVWNNVGTYTYGEEGPTVTGLPDGLFVEYSYHTEKYNSDPDEYYQGGDAGLNKRNAVITVDTSADGYTNVEITKPDDWSYDGHNYVITADSVEYTVTKRLLTMDDFYLTIDGVRLNDPYEFTYDGQYHTSGIGTDLPVAIFGEFRIERGDWNADGHGLFDNQCEVGEYVFSGFIYTYAYTYGNFGFDENDANVELLTEDYEYNGETIIDLDQLQHKYILHFSFTWSIVE